MEVRRAALLVLVASSAWAADIGATLVSVDEAEPIHSAVVRKEAWTQEAVRWLRIDANRRLKEGPWTVTSDRPQGLDLDPHEYYSESPYWWSDPAQPGGYVRRPGQRNASRFSANRTALDSMCDAVLSLGTAAFLLDDPSYAQHAARIVYAWFINPKTRMNPDMDRAGAIPAAAAPAPGPAIAEGKPLIWAIQGMELLAQTGKWDPKEEAAVHKWFDEYLHWLAQAPQRPGGDNSMWRGAIEAAVASFVEDAAAQRLVFARYQNRIPPEPPRTLPDSAGPAMVNGLEARSMLCRIAQVHGTDLWSARSGRGRTLAGAIDRFIATLPEAKAWSKDQLADFETDGVYFLAFAGIGMNRPDYIAQYRKLERDGSARLALVDLITGRWEAAAHQTRH
jgi:hypothetical protein